jgi:hypothetical protein
MGGVHGQNRRVDKRINAVNADFYKKGGQGVGRKNKFETHVKPRFEEIRQWYQDMNETEIVKHLGISTRAWENYKKNYPELTELLKESKAQLKQELKETLKKKAKGFTYNEVKTTKKIANGKVVSVTQETYERYAQPDLGSIHLLLKNIDPEWTNDDKTTIDIKKRQLDLTERKIEQDEW